MASERDGIDGVSMENASIGIQLEFAITVGIGVLGALWGLMWNRINKLEDKIDHIMEMMIKRGDSYGD